MSLPRISVVVAVYNQDRFIGRCLRSLLAQSLPHYNYEVVVVNDGSTDLTHYALSQFVDPKDNLIRIFHNDKNHGLPAAANRGIRESRGQYIVRVDSDDFVNSNFLNILGYYLDNNLSADAVACDYLIVDDNEHIIERKSSATFPIACGIMFRKEHLIKIGLYDESFLRREEEDLRIRFEKNYTIDNLKLPLYRYRMHDSNITNDTSAMDFFSRKLSSKHN